MFGLDKLFNEMENLYWYDKRTFTPTRAVRFTYSMSETNVVSKSQRKLSRVKVVYQYNDVLLMHEPALLMDIFERQASFETNPFYN